MPARPLTMTPTSKDRAAARAIQVVLYARVSSKDQEKEGFSIPAQLRLLRDYAASKGFAIAHEFTDVETAKESGRTNFGQMLAYLKKHPGVCRTILVEKTDRLYRNIKDYGSVDELDVEIHLVKENEVISRESRSSEQFVHGIKVLMARNYSLNLAEETIKGMTEKARAGMYPSYAPVGYRNIAGVDGKRIIVPAPDAASVITELLERFAAGRHSLKALVRECNAEGLKLRGRKLYRSLVHHILRKRVYTGDFDWDGTTYLGTHEPLVTRECWQRGPGVAGCSCQEQDSQNEARFRLHRAGALRPLRLPVGGRVEKRKVRVLPLHRQPGQCTEPYTRQEILTREFGNVLQELVIPQAILEWLGDAVLTSDQTEQAARAQTIKKLQARYDQIQARIETMALDKLDGRISQEVFDKHSGSWRVEQDGLLRKIQDIQKATPAPIDQAIDMLRLTSRASELFLQQPAVEQRRLLQMVVEKAAWKDGALQTALFEPFEILRHSNQESCRKEKEETGSGRELGIWLPGMDSNFVHGFGFRDCNRSGWSLTPGRSVFALRASNWTALETFSSPSVATLLTLRGGLSAFNSLTCAASSESASPFKVSGGPSESSPRAQSRGGIGQPSPKATARSSALPSDRRSSRYSAALAAGIGTRSPRPAATMRVTASRITFFSSRRAQ